MYHSLSNESNKERANRYKFQTFACSSRCRCSSPLRSLYKISRTTGTRIYIIFQRVSNARNARHRPWRGCDFISQFVDSSSRYGNQSIRVDRARCYIFRIEFLNHRELFVKKRRQIAIRKKIFELCIIIFIDGEMNIYIYGTSLFVFREDCVSCIFEIFKFVEKIRENYNRHKFNITRYRFNVICYYLKRDLFIEIKSRERRNKRCGGSVWRVKFTRINCCTRLRKCSLIV